MSHYINKIKQHLLLEKSFSYVIENNKSANLPYHNTRHLIKVFNSSMDIAKYYKLSKHETIILGVAALFHDFNHSGGKLKDNENIQIAIEEFNIFYKENNELFDGVHYPSIMDLITYTEFPKVKEPESITQQILVDADLIQCYDTDWILFAIKGLADERCISVKQSLSDQINFINNVKYYTKYAQKLHNRKKKKYSKKLNYLKIIF